LLNFITNKGFEIPSFLFPCPDFEEKYTQHMQRIQAHHSIIKPLASPVSAADMIRLQLEVNEQTILNPEQVESLINSPFFLTQGLELTKFPQAFFTSKVLELIL